MFLAVLQLKGSDEQAKVGARLLDTACSKRDALGCLELAIVLLDGSVVPADAQRAKRLLDDSCTDLPEACAALGNVYDEGAGVAPAPERAHALYEQACAAGAAMGCTNAGSQYYYGRGTKRNLVRAAEFHERACRAGSQYGCVNLGRAMLTGDGVKADPERAATLFEQACNMHKEPGCVSLAQWYVSAHLGFARAKILLEQSCATRYPEACATLGYYLLKGFTPTDPKRAQDLLRYACDRNVAEGCHNLACTWEDKNDLAAANPAHEKACLLGDMESCEIAGWHLSAGDVVHVDEARAFKYLTLACDAARPVACAELGTFFDMGRGVPKDLPHALALYDRACRAEAPVGCLWLGLTYRDGKGVPTDEHRGTALIQKGCRLGNELACGELGLSYLEGIGIRADPNKSIPLLRHACLAGVGIACSNLASVYYNGKFLPRELPLARRLYSKGCSAPQANADACFNRAGMESAGLGGPADTSAAADGYRSACRMGLQKACPSVPK